MNYEAALKAVVERTGHKRFEWLCSDDNPNPVNRQHYRELVIRLADKTSKPGTPPLTPLRYSMRAVKTGYRRCFYSEHKGCGCSGTRCFWKGKIVGLRDCIECLTQVGTIK